MPDWLISVWKTGARARTAISKVAIALACAAAAYFLMARTLTAGLISISFLIVLPAAITAFVCYTLDPHATRTRKSYLLVPVWLIGIAMALGAVVFSEGVICVAMASPVWLGFGLLAAEMTYRKRSRKPHSDVFCSGILALPFVMMAIEPQLPRPWHDHVVERSIEISAQPTAIWSMMRGIGDVRDDEGRWTFAQSVLGIPRPRNAELVGEGVGAQRNARWQRGVHFREMITAWQPPEVQSGRSARLDWRFDFTGSAGWQFTDSHLRPDSDYFQVIDGGYRLSPIEDGRYRLTLVTHYRSRSPIDPYTTMWGEVLIGDIESNVLSIIGARADLPSE